MTFEAAYFENMAVERRSGMRKLRHYLHVIGRHVRCGRLLDYGCATGDFLGLARSSYSVTGFEVSHFAAARARERLSGVTVCETPEELEALEPFDVITSFDVLEHIPDLDATLRQLQQLLRPEGVLVMVVPVYDTWAGHLVGLLDRDPTHVNKWSRGAWLDRMSKSSWKLVEALGQWRYLALGRWYIHFASSPAVSPAILTVWRK
ncbi:MAG: class I SAM-dependent methyltransferase [Candidatus Xenobia bacterium]